MSFTRLLTWSKIPVRSSTVQMRKVPTIAMIARQMPARKESFTVDQKSMYTSLSRTCLADAGRRDDFLASFSATLLLIYGLFLPDGLRFFPLCLVIGWVLRIEVALGVLRQSDDLVRLGETCKDDTHGVTALGGYLGHGRAYHLAAGKNHQDLVVLIHDQGAHQIAPIVAQLGHLDAQPAAVLEAVLVGRGALRIPALGHHEDVALVRHDRRVEQRVLAA